MCKNYNLLYLLIIYKNYNYFTFPYSKSYEISIVEPGKFPFLLMGMHGTLRYKAINGAKIKPRVSNIAIQSI